MDLRSCLFGSHLTYLCTNNCVAMGLFSCLFEFHLKDLCANNRIAVGLLAGQGWRVKRAYPVYDVQRENKTVGLGLFKPLK